MAVPNRIQRGRWRLPVAAFSFSFLGVLAGPGLAAEPAGAGVEVIPVVPAAPRVAPDAPSPRVPVPIIRFRCTVEAGASSCRDPSGSSGGGEESCDCARDFCYRDPAGARICEKS